MIPAGDEMLKRTRGLVNLIGWVAVLVISGAGALGAENMIGRQTQNEGILIVPKPSAVEIDGKLDDWDWSGRIWVFADKAIRDRYSVEVAAMWDTDYLYLAAKWLDPTPLVNNVNPAFNVDDGWKSDCWQLRLQSDCVVHYTTWYYTPKQQANFHVTYSPSASGGETFLLTGPNGKVLDRGVQVAFRQTGPNSYNQEMRVPWSLVYRKVPAIKAGLALRIGNEFLWGDVTGKTFPTHRYADNMQPGVTSREFYWKATQAWGNATLVAAGNLPVRQYVSDEGILAGTLPIRVEIPADAVRFTVALDDAAGNRVRNLAGDFDPRDYTANVSNGRRTVAVLWDGLNDDGKPVASGSYTARGLSHRGLGAAYDLTYYNPGTPPWQTVDGTGGWGGNHPPPRGVARSGDRMIVYWPSSEGEHAIIGLNADGRKIWGELTGALELTADAASVYFVAGGQRRQAQELSRLDAATGRYKPYVLEGKERPLYLSLAELLGRELPGEAVSITTDGQRLAVAFSGGLIALLDAESAQLLDTLPLAGVQAVAFATDNQLLALAKGVLTRIDLATRTPTTIPTPGLGQGTRLAVDRNGNALILDRGPDSQVKAYTTAGALVYTAGRKGGRPWSGMFDKQAMLMMSSVAVDSQSRIWVVESWNNPRRVSVWGRDGKLVRDYIGNSGYAGGESWLDEADSSLAYVGPLEMRLDRATRSYRLTRILWAPDATKGEAFPMWRDKHWYSSPQAIVSAAAGGKPIRYIYHNGVYSQWHAVFIDDGQIARPVAAIANAAYLTGAVPGLDLGTTDKNTAVFWTDKNGDAAVSRDECIVGSKLSLSASWGNRIANDLSFYLSGVNRVKPVGFTATGAPIYTPASIESLALKEKGEFVPVPGATLVLCLSTDAYPKPSRLIGFDSKTSRVAWSYPNPYPGVHGSHRAPMPEPGLIIGTTKICGIADVGGDVGQVFAIRGNLGQDFYLTTDGLYIGAMFQDCRLPAEALPPTEDQLAAMSMDGFSEGGEPFSGWFGKQGDGRIRMLTSLARTGAMIVRINGLDTIKRFAPVTVLVDDIALARAIAANAARQATATGPKTYTIQRVTKSFHIDGKPDDWESIPMLLVDRPGSPNKATVKLAYDTQNLYALFEVGDPSPWLNEGKDAKRLFKTGDAVDIQLGSGDGSMPSVGDQRIVFGRQAGETIAILMRPVDKRAPEELRHVYSSPVGDKAFDRVERLADATVKVVTYEGGYRLEAAIPLKILGLSTRPGTSWRGDVGFISSDAGGTINVARTYWSNKETNLVNDEPLEAWFKPSNWGAFTLGN